MGSLSLIVIGVVAASLSMPVLAEQDNTVVVVVARASPIHNLDLDDLRATFRGFPPVALESKVVSLAYLKGKIERFFDGRALGLSSRQVKIYWLRRVFEGEANRRRYCRDTNALKSFVSQNNSALGFIYARDLDESVRAITIDGHDHEDVEYLLRGD